jgi:hypothetical protein
MKNVKILLIFMAISTLVFASSTRTNALGGAGFWADDYANVWNFPADVNNHNVAYTSGNNFATIFDHDDTKWGFAGGSDANEVVNMNWGNGTIGARFGLNMSPASASGVTPAVEAKTEFSFGVGMPLADMDFGFGYGADGMIGVNLRRAQNVWLWDNMLINFGMTPEKKAADNAGAFQKSNMQFGVDCYTNRSYGEGTSGLFALGFHYGAPGAATEGGTAPDATMNLVWNFAVESAMTDWGTLRLGYATMHDFGGGTNEAGELTVGLGINYGSFNLDMDISSSAGKVLKDPIKWAAGRNSDNDGSLAGSWTISYNW